MFNSITLAHSGIINATPPEDIVGSSSLTVEEGTKGLHFFQIRFRRVDVWDLIT